MSSVEPAPPRVEVRGMTKRFGDLLALDDVSLTLEPGAFHAILGENGAGKSTLAKCLVGYDRPDAGRVVIDGRERAITSPRQAHELGLGMVYQHFTLVPSMTGAENLVLGRRDLPAVVRWKAERERLEAFQARMPFAVDLDRPVATLAAGQKQKLEILKLLYLGRRVLILDEPTSVLTPDEAAQVLGSLREAADARRVSVILITHKFREVLAFAREATVLRDGRRVGGGPVADLRPDDLVRWMIGGTRLPSAAARAAGAAAPPTVAACGPGPAAAPVATTRAPAPATTAALEVRDLVAVGDRGVPAVRGVRLAVRGGEIVGVAGVSGNGQRELVEVLAGQREPEAGEIRVAGAPYRRTRAEMRARRVFVLTEEPLRNAAVRSMSVAENLALRVFDDPRFTRARIFVSRRALRAHARTLIDRFGIRTRGPDARLDTLSGGNVQRTMLARELSGDVAVLIAHNPCAGLDLAATAEIRARLLGARAAGTAVLLLSEDLDELLELADRLLVIFEGRIVYEVGREAADPHLIARHMVGRG